MAGGNASVILPIDFKDHEGLRLAVRRREPQGVGRQSEVLARRERRDRRRVHGRRTRAATATSCTATSRRTTSTSRWRSGSKATAGSGIQYRSKTNLPWLAGINTAVANNNGPVNLDWMTTGPQADFWPTTEHTGQTYSENTPMRIQVRRGFVGEGYGYGPRRHLGTVGDPAALQSLIKLNDWNEYTVIARGPVVIHIINGATMAVMIDDDPKSSNNWSGQIGVELEATGRSRSATSG